MPTSRLIIFASTTSLTRILLIKKKLIYKNLYHILLTDERDERSRQGDRAIAQGHSNMRHWTVLDVISLRRAERCDSEEADADLKRSSRLLITETRSTRTPSTLRVVIAAIRSRALIGRAIV